MHESANSDLSLLHHYQSSRVIIMTLSATDKHVWIAISVHLLRLNGC